MILFSAWISMLFIGIAHHLDGRVPALGYWTVVALAIAARFLLSGLPTTSLGKKPATVVNQTITTGKAHA